MEQPLYRERTGADPMEGGQDKMRQMLIVQELGKSEFELGDPEIERVAGARQRLARAPDHEEVE